MTRAALLNNIDHRDLRIITTRSAEYGDDISVALTFPAEFRNCQAHYPIVFQKTGDAEFQPVLLLGLRPEENLFLKPHGWDAHYLPLSVERQPFMIGSSGDQLVMHIDIDHPRVSKREGEPLFREHGGTTEYLERMNSVLLSLHEGLQHSKDLSAALTRLELLESFVLDVTLDDGSENRLSGYYTINEERLRQLAPQAVAELHAQGLLEPVYMTLASLSQFRGLIERLRRRLRRD
ncbi:SapC family protein [Pseudomarimonas arenosa]|uniref:SapC family protein n=1 Tax=Pseudomarimonas arenosa TaxID=2774145 RepID=A0AAW3ZRD0_9GAMM|nr:SapC family protein [Pseudomarimonas arenosa]MBD8526806.1 SapC family protein [Pseudomarimonas arenosa]